MTLEPAEDRAGRWDVVLLLMLPFALLALDGNWTYSKLTRDPWIYFGYYLNLPGHLRGFDAYYGSRLSVIIPGALVHRLLPPVPANLVLHLSLYGTSILALYGTLKLTVGRRGALLAALLLGTYPSFLEAIGRDYVDAFGMTYFLLTMYLVTRGGRSASVLAGVAASALVVANLFYAVLLPLPVMQALALGRGRARLAGDAALAGLGGAALLAAFGVFHHAITGHWNFLAPSLRFVAQVGGSQSGSGSILDWLPWDGALALPLLALVGAAVVRSPHYWQFVVLVAIEIAYSCFMSSAALNNGFYTSLLLPPAALALGPALARMAAALRPRPFDGVAACFVAALALANAVPAVESSFFRLSLPSLLLAAPALVVGALVLWQRSPEPTAIIAFAGSVCVLGVLTRPLVEFETEPRLRVAANSTIHRQLIHYREHRGDVFRTIADATRAILATDSSGEVRFWFNLLEPHGLLFDNIACTHLSGPRLLGREFPNPRDAAIRLSRRQLPDGTLIVLLSSEPDALQRAYAALARVGRRGELIRRQSIARPDIKFDLLLIEIR